MPALPHPRGLLDTSVFIALEQRREIDYGALPLAQYVSAITRGELLAGVHAAHTVDTRAVRLSTVEQLAGVEMLAVDSRAATHWAALRHSLASAGRRVNVNDLWIASVALAHDLPVVTQDGDFDVIAEICGLRVIRV